MCACEGEMCVRVGVMTAVEWCEQVRGREGVAIIGPSELTLTLTLTLRWWVSLGLKG